MAVAMSDSEFLVIFYADLQQRRQSSIQTQYEQMRKESIFLPPIQISNKNAEENLLLHTQMVHFLSLVKFFDLLVVKSICLVEQRPVRPDVVYLHGPQKFSGIIHKIHLLTKQINK